MFVSFKMDDGSTLYASMDGDGVRLENYSEARGLVFGKTIKPEDATELKRFLEAKGF